MKMDKVCFRNMKTPYHRYIIKTGPNTYLTNIWSTGRYTESTFMSDAYWLNSYNMAKKWKKLLKIQGVIIVQIEVKVTKIVEVEVIKEVTRHPKQKD